MDSSNACPLQTLMSIYHKAPIYNYLVDNRGWIFTMPMIYHRIRSTCRRNKSFLQKRMFFDIWRDFWLNKDIGYLLRTERSSTLLYPFSSCLGPMGRLYGMRCLYRSYLCLKMPRWRSFWRQPSARLHGFIQRV
jgi:hypothetical protein